MRAAVILRIMTCIIVLAQMPIIVVHLQNLWRYPHYQYFPLLIIVMIGFLWSYLAAEETADGDATVNPNSPPQQNFVTLYLPSMLLLVSGLMLHGLSIFHFSPWLGMVAFNLILGGMMCWYVPRNHLLVWTGIWMLSWLLVPLPLGLDQQLIEKLQGWSSRLSSRFLDIVQVNHLMEGNTLKIPGKSLFVDEACSGVQSFFSLLSLTAIYCVYVRRSWMQSLFLLGSVLPWSVIMNTLRISSIALLDGKTAWDLAHGTPHEVLGLIVFSCTFILMLSTDQLIYFLTSPINYGGNQYTIDGRETNYFVKWWNRIVSGQFLRKPSAKTTMETPGSPAGKLIFGVFMAVALSLLFVPQLIAVTPQLNLWKSSSTSADEKVSSPLNETALQLGEDSLPQAIQGCNRVSFRTEKREMYSIYGHHSRIWTYNKGAHAISISVDFPFPEVHDLTKCYRGQGWFLTSYHESITVGKDQSKVEPYLLFSLSNPFEEYGQVWTSTLNPKWQFESGFRQQHASSKTEKAMSVPSQLTGDYYQVQMLVFSPEKLLPEEQEFYSSMYQEVRNLIRKQFTAGS